MMWLPCYFTLCDIVFKKLVVYVVVVAVVVERYVRYDPKDRPTRPQQCHDTQSQRYGYLYVHTDREGWCYKCWAELMQYMDNMESPANGHKSTQLCLICQ